MNRSFLAILLIVLLFFAGIGLCGAQESAPTQSHLNLLFGPLGFLQFGPTTDLEVGFSSNLYGIVHVRLHGLGLLSYLLYDVTPAVYSVAVGPGLRYLFPIKGSPHAPYVGFLTEFGYNPYTGDAGYSSEYTGTTTYVTVAMNGGFRWQFDNFLLDVGAYAGVAPTLSDEYAYKSDPAVTYQGQKITTFFGMVELSLGFRL